MNNFLDHFTSDDVLTTQKVSLRMPYSSFEGLIAFTRNEISTDAYMDLFYFHSIIEKCIVSFKGRDLHTGRYIYAQIENFDRNTVPHQVRQGVESAFLACAAYNQYATGKYKEAYDHLLALVPHVVEQKKLMPMFLANLYEQNLNMLRIHFRQNDPAKIGEKFTQLADSILFNINDAITFDKDLSALDTREKNTWFFYIMDSFIIGMNNTFKNDPEGKRQLYIHVLEHILEQDRLHPTPFREFIKGITMVLYAQKRDVDAFIKMAADEFDSIKHCPSLIRTLVLSRFVGFANEEGWDLQQHPNYPYFESVAEQYNVKLNGKVSNAA